MYFVQILQLLNSKVTLQLLYYNLEDFALKFKLG